MPRTYTCDELVARLAALNLTPGVDRYQCNGKSNCFRPVLTEGAMCGDCRGPSAEAAKAAIERTWAELDADPLLGTDEVAP